ncbi:MAG: V-type ATP synthase subunit E [Oscillospiraceae bacterium]
MKGIDKITSRIIADAEAECRDVKRESDERCAAVRAENEKRAQDEYWRLVREGVKDTEQRVQRMDRTARLEAKKSVLNMKQEAVSRAFDLAKDKIAELPERDYVAFLAREAAEAAITGQEEVIFCERDRKSVGAKAVKAANELLAAKGMPGLLTLSDATRDMAGGLMLKQGDIEVNCTVDTLLDLTRDELAARVADVLFES